MDFCSGSFAALENYLRSRLPGKETQSLMEELRLLLVPQGVDGIEVGGPHGRSYAEDDAHADAHNE